MGVEDSRQAFWLVLIGTVCREDGRDLSKNTDGMDAIRIGDDVGIGILVL
jgi:hypothetical protein